jgi:4-diphosphocytidyl-2-C-methyl-D-erythritol kinase
VTVRVPAKLNLQLAVGPPRADGYHDLVTVFQAVSLFDEVTVAPARKDTVTVTGEGAGSVPVGKDNLVIKAAAALASTVGLDREDGYAVSVSIRKRIPVAAGLAGGSADAAAALVACNSLWSTGLSQQELCEVGAAVGSDVAFAVLGGTAVGQGRGERLTPALVSGRYHWVLAFAAGALSTADVYATLDKLRAARGDVAAGRAAVSGTGASRRRAGAASFAPVLNTVLMCALRSGDPAAVGAALGNQMQPAAVSLFPALRKTLAAGRELGALGAVVAGSGPTCAFLAESEAHAVDLAVSLSGAGVCRAAVRAAGPVPGATVIPGAR